MSLQSTISLQSCFICGLETACPTRLDYITGASAPQIKALRVGAFARNAARLGLYKNSEAVLIEAGITIDLPCGHCVHTKCLKQYVIDNPYLCKLCGFPFPPFPMRKEGIVRHLYRVFTEKVGRLMRLPARQEDRDLVIIVWSILVLIAVLVVMKMYTPPAQKLILSAEEIQNKRETRRNFLKLDDEFTLESLGIKTLNDFNDLNADLAEVLDESGKDRMNWTFEDFSTDMQSFYESNQRYIFDYFDRDGILDAKVKFLASHPLPPSAGIPRVMLAIPGSKVLTDHRYFIRYTGR